MSKPSIYYVEVLNMPAWLRAPVSESRDGFSVEIDNAIYVRKTPGEMVERWIGYGNHGQIERHSMGDRDDILTPDKEEVLLIAPKSGYYCNLTLQDIGRFREWRERGGPKYDPQIKVNARKGETMFIGTLACIETGVYPEQPWGSKEPEAGDPDDRIAQLQKQINDLKSAKEEKLKAELAALEETKP